MKKLPNTQSKRFISKVFKIILPVPKLKIGDRVGLSSFIYRHNLEDSLSKARGTVLSILPPVTNGTGRQKQFIYLVLWDSGIRIKHYERELRRI